MTNLRTHIPVGRDNLTPDDGTVLVTFPDVPEAVTLGADEDEAMLYAVDVLETALSMYVDARKLLPSVSKPLRGQKTAKEIRKKGGPFCHYYP